MLEEVQKPTKPEHFHTEPVNFIDNENQKKRFFSNKRTGLIMTTIFLSLIAGFFIFLRTFSTTSASNDPYEYDPVTLEPKKQETILNKISNFVFSKAPEIIGKKDDRINILLLGMGGPGHDGPFLTDTIIIGSIKPSTSQIAMVSIPRDLAISVPEQGVRKINSVNAFGEAKKAGDGGLYTKQILQDTFDIKMPYYVRVDFEAFKEIVDAIGGIKIDVERAFTDREFPDNSNGVQSLTFTKGVQNMDGKRALQYARSRHGDNGEGSDFARAKRQQKVILAVKEKVLSFQTIANPIRISKIIKSLGSHIDTNIEFANMISLLKIGRSMNVADIITLVFDNGKEGHLVDSYNSSGAYILSPKTGNFDEMNVAIKNIFEMKGEKINIPTQNAPAPESIDTGQNMKVEEKTITQGSNEENIEIQNGTWRAGLASRVKEKLKEDNVSVYSVGNTQTRPTMESGIYTLSKEIDVKKIEFLKSSLNIPIKTALPPNEKAASSTDILIILGENFTE